MTLAASTGCSDGGGGVFSVLAAPRLVGPEAKGLQGFPTADGMASDDEGRGKCFSSVLTASRLDCPEARKLPGFPTADGMASDDEG